VPSKKENLEDKPVDEVNMMFQDGCVMKGHTMGENVLIDKDYEEHNKTYNRVKNYSFERVF